MRKFGVLIGCVALTALMGVQAMAQGSKAQSIGVNQESALITIEDEDGNLINLVPVLSESSDPSVQLSDGYVDSDGTEYTVKNQYLFDVSMASVESGDIYSLGNRSVTLTFSVPGVTPNSAVIVRHLMSNGSLETPVPTIGNGTVTVTLTGLSPVSITVLEAVKSADATVSEEITSDGTDDGLDISAPEVTDDGSDIPVPGDDAAVDAKDTTTTTTATASTTTAAASSQSATTGKTSPKTGEGNGIVIFEIMAMMCLLGAGYSFRKIRA